MCPILSSVTPPSPGPPSRSSSRTRSATPTWSFGVTSTRSINLLLRSTVRAPLPTPLTCPGQKVTGKAVSELVLSLYIQVDNLWSVVDVGLTLTGQRLHAARARRRARQHVARAAAARDGEGRGRPEAARPAHAPHRAQARGGDGRQGPSGLDRVPSHPARPSTSRRRASQAARTRCRSFSARWTSSSSAAPSRRRCVLAVPPG